LILANCSAGAESTGVIHLERGLPAGALVKERTDRARLLQRHAWNLVPSRSQEPFGLRFDERGGCDRPTAQSHRIQPVTWPTSLGSIQYADANVRS
jgi:hypothetical protein